MNFYNCNRYLMQPLVLFLCSVHLFSDFLDLHIAVDFTLIEVSNQISPPQIIPTILAYFPLQLSVVLPFTELLYSQ